MSPNLSNKVRVILIGFGYWGPNLLRNLLSHRGFEVVSVVDQRAEARNKCAAMYPTVPTHEDLNWVLRELKPEAAIIATPPRTHAELSVKCMEAGADILVEKPLALSVAECERILKCAEEKRRRVMVDHTFVYNTAVQHIQKYIRSGEFGDPMYYNSVRVNFGGFQTGTNVLWDLAPHDLSMLDYFFDGLMPDRVAATGISHFAAKVEDLCYLHLYYGSKFSAHLHLSWVAPLKIRTVVLGGTRQMAVYDEGLPGERVKYYDKALVQDAASASQYGYRLGNMTAPAIPETEALGTIMREFHNCITAGSTPVSNAGMGYRIVQILEAASKSLVAGGEVVTLPKSSLNLSSVPTKKAA